MIMMMRDLAGVWLQPELIAWQLYYAAWPSGGLFHIIAIIVIVIIIIVVVVVFFSPLSAEVRMDENITETLNPFPPSHGYTHSILFALPCSSVSLLHLLASPPPWLRESLPPRQFSSVYMTPDQGWIAQICTVHELRTQTSERCFGGLGSLIEWWYGYGSMIMSTIIIIIIINSH